MSKTSKIDLSTINKKYVLKEINDLPIAGNKKPVKIHHPKPDKAPEKKKTKEKPKSIKFQPLEKANEPNVHLSDVEKYKKIKVLELYVAEFPNELCKYQRYDFNKCSDQKLIDLKNEFDKNISSKNNLHWGVSASQQALIVYEQICKLSGLEVDGISKLGQDPEWIKNVKAVCLKYLDNNITTIEPEHQLLFMLFQHTMTLHYLNTSLPETKKTIKKEVEKVPDIEIDLDKITKINDEYIDI